MIKKSYSVVSDYILVALIVIFSGNPIIRFLGIGAVPALAIILLVIKYKEVEKGFFPKFFIIAASLMVLFISQYLMLGFVSWLGAYRYILIFLFGGLVFNLVGERFSYTFFIFMYYASLISLGGFVVINLMNVHIPGLTWGQQRLTWLVYTFVEEHHYRNSGMFWEPGAFAGILTLCIALNINTFPMLWKNHKLKIFVLIVALLTTKSTTGYLIFFIIVIFYLVFFVRVALIKVTVIPAIFLTIFIVYENADFLQQKIKDQTVKSASIVNGQFTNTRFGSFMLDMHYIKKHPFVGNGLNEITRYADDPLLIQRLAAGDNLANANGFSNFLACLGIPFMFFYLLSCFLGLSKVDARVASLLILVILLSLWGEQWLGYPIYAALMFIKVKRYDNENYP